MYIHTQAANLWFHTQICSFKTFTYQLSKYTSLNKIFWIFYCVVFKINYTKSHQKIMNINIKLIIQEGA